MIDKEIFDLIKKESIRQTNDIELIASENYTYKDVMEASGSTLTNKYAEGYPHARYYGGCEVVDEVEELAINRVKKLFSVNYANVQPHSGSTANMAALFALINRGDKIMGMNLSEGGHLTHGFHVNFSGKLYESCSYGVNGEGYIDYDDVMKIAKKEKPKVIIAGASAYSREIDFKRFREIADEVGAYLMADIAHIAGLVATGLHNSPIKYAHVVTSTTHKTLRGIRGGIILSDEEEISKKIDKAVFPGVQGGPLMHIIAAKAVGFHHNLQDDYKTYMKNVKENSFAMAERFKKNGFDIVTGGTDNHMFLVSLVSRDMTGKDASDILGKFGIIVNKNTIPNDTKSPFITSGIRIGTPAITSRGFTKDDVIKVADLIKDILDNRVDNEKEARTIIEELCNNHPIK